MLLMYPYGAPSVRCSSCCYVTEIGVCELSFCSLSILVGCLFISTYVYSGTNVGTVKSLVLRNIRESYCKKFDVLEPRRVLFLLLL